MSPPVSYKVQNLKNIDDQNNLAKQKKLLCKHRSLVFALQTGKRQKRLCIIKNTLIGYKNYLSYATRFHKP